jgi:hypothetical protein
MKLPTPQTPEEDIDLWEERTGVPRDAQKDLRRQRVYSHDIEPPAQEEAE